MKIRCITNQWKNLSPETLARIDYEASFDELQVGLEHTVYGIDIVSGVVHYLIVDKWGSGPSWYPAEMFEIIDQSPSFDWSFKFYSSLERLNAVWGYKELLDYDHYIGLIERETKDMEIFWKRKMEIDRDEIMRRFGSCAYSLASLGINAFAWQYDDALKVAEYFSQCGFMILGGDVYHCDGTTLEITYDNWFTDQGNSDEKVLIQQALNKTNEYISAYRRKHGGDYLYSLVITSGS